ncbi:MAG: hypothetical protein QNJ38_08615 [Prochloraceae cyanobacterium]|nr:hypothetical protein [Prochloraceae cyanobacterium]
MILKGKTLNDLLGAEINTLLSDCQVFLTENIDNSIPLTIILVEKFAPSFNADLQTSLEQKLESFLNKYYSPQATLFLGTACENEEFNSQDTIARLFESLQGNPTLILESEITANSLSLSLAYWGLNETEYSYNSILDNYQSAKLKETDYLEKFLLNSRCLIASWILDYYYLDAYGKSPLLPKLLSKLIKVIDSQTEKEQILEHLVAGYDAIYQKTAPEEPKLIPQLYLELATVLIDLERRDLAKKLVQSSFKTWLKLNGSGSFARRDLLDKISDRLSDSDRKYLKKLNKIYHRLNEPAQAKLVEQYLRQVKASQQLIYWQESMFKMPIFRGKIY